MESKDDPERVSLDPLDPVTALRALLAVDPDAEPVEEAEPVEQARADPSIQPGEDEDQGIREDREAKYQGGA